MPFWPSEREVRRRPETETSETCFVRRNEKDKCALRERANYERCGACYHEHIGDDGRVNIHITIDDARAR